jgi:putative redox protein
MESKVVWNGKMAFSGSAESGFSLPLDADLSVGGEAQGFRPMELLAIGLAGCTAMDVIAILTKKRQVISAFDVQVHTERAETHPKVFTSAVIEYHVYGQSVDEAAVLRAIELSTTAYCPAQAMLGQIMPIELKYYIFEEALDGQRSLVKSGAFHQPQKAQI